LNPSPPAAPLPHKESVPDHKELPSHYQPVEAALDDIDFCYDFTKLIDDLVEPLSEKFQAFTTDTRGNWKFARTLRVTRTVKEWQCFTIGALSETPNLEMIAWEHFFEFGDIK
jgi:hypothetical protein